MSHDREVLEVLPLLRICSKCSEEKEASFAHGTFVCQRCRDALGRKDVLESFEPPSAEEVEECRRGMLANGWPALLVRQMIASLSMADRGWVYVPELHKKVEVDLPYPGKQALETVKLVMSYHVGKPIERKEVVVSARRLEDLRSLSDAELAEILDGEVVEGPRELPPAA